MNEAWVENYQSENRSALIDALGEIYDQLSAQNEQEPRIDKWPSWPQLDELCRRFDLDEFARQALLLATGTELNGYLADLIGRINGTPPGPPSIATLFRLSTDADWSALSPQAPLRWFYLLEDTSAEGFTDKRLRPAERVLHFLLGVSAMEPRLEALLQAQPGNVRLAPDQIDIARHSADLLPSVRCLQLTGGEAGTRRAIAAAAAAILQRNVLILDQADIPGDATEREAFARLWMREARLNDVILALDITETSTTGFAAAAALAARLPGGMFLLTQDAQPAHMITATRITIPGLDLNARRRLWTALLADEDLGKAKKAKKVKLAALAEALAGQFQLSVEAMQASLRAARAEIAQSKTGLDTALWNAARSQSRAKIADLAERIETSADWDDIVLPPNQMAVLHEIAEHTGGRSKVYEDWGFREKLSARGLGITALFSGPSGTGKTLAAEVLAGALSLDLYRVDLSAVISKYIGETEKNLGRIFDAAELGGAILLFDEADALFGKRSEVKDSHDRYANIEVSYLLQRMETYSGLAILTTNLKANLDSAFIRRLRFIIDFPFPAQAEREAIWARVFPDRAPLGDINPRRLSQLNVPGGAIRNIALNAAFRAAARGDRIEMRDLHRAAQSEYSKLEKPLTTSEIKGWGLDE